MTETARATRAAAGAEGVQGAAIVLRDDARHLAVRGEEVYKYASAVTDRSSFPMR